MNFLAHTLLAQRTGTSLFGNFLGDFVKGPVNELALPQTLQQGVRLHRKIDILTDNHPRLVQSRNRFSATERRYAGIILDITFDHFLSRHWSAFCEHQLSSVVELLYCDIELHREFLPVNKQDYVQRLVSQNWLLNYQHLDGLQSALSGVGNRLARRLGTNNVLALSIAEVESNYAALEQDFLDFFPELLIQTKIQALALKGD